MRLYRLLLRVYPASFRYEYGEELARLFAERRRQSSAAGRLALWAEAVGDALGTAPRVHLDILRQDLRYTWRTLSRTPGFVAAAIVVMALGIGATTAVFSVTDRVLLRPLSFHEPHRLVRVWENAPGTPQLHPSPANFRDWTQMTGSFETLTAFFPFELKMARDEPERIQGTALGGGFLRLLGVQPAMGRDFTPEEETLGGPDSVILSDRLWRRKFGADPSVLGQTLNLDDTPHTIVGVMPPDFFFPDRTAELWVTLTMGPGWYTDRDNAALSVVGRLKPGVSLEMVRDEMNGIMAALERAYPRENAQTRATVRLIGDQVSWQSRLLIRVLTAASLCLLLIACTNLASLLMTRFSARRRELTVRAALGAGRERLTRQLLTESLVLSIAGGAAGIGFAVFATPLVARLVPTTLPVPDATVLDPRVLLFAVVTTLLTGVAFGVLPAWRLCRGAQRDSLREDARGAAAGRDRLRATLVVAQIAASVLLLISASLLMRAFMRVQATDPGFVAGGVLSMRTTLPMPRYAKVADRSQFYERVLGEVRALPGVTAAAYTTFTPMVMPGGIWQVEMPGIDRQRNAAEVHTASLRYVTPGYFATLGVPILGGRDVAGADTFDAPFVAIVSESFAKRYWPNGDAIGERFTFAFFERTIVGVAGDIRNRGLESVSEPQVYLPYRQIRDGWMQFYAPKDLLVRVAGDPMALAAAVRLVIREADAALAISDVQTMEDVIAGTVAPRRTQTAVMWLFAGMSLLLAGIGLHGLLSFGVSQRRQEIGIRIALGASHGGVLRLVAGESLRLAGIGAVIGMGLAYAASRTFESLLAGVEPSDPPTYGVAAALTGVMVLSGTVAPALRALRLDPARALRDE
jgi:putative ABC transport system permease protein